MLSLEDRLKMQLGANVMQILALQTELDRLHAELASRPAPRKKAEPAKE